MPDADEGTRVDLEASATPMDAEAATVGGDVSQSESPVLDEHQKEGSDTEAGQEEAEAEVEEGTIDADADTEVDLETTT